MEWSVFGSIVECSMMNSIKRTKVYLYHSNVVKVQVPRSSYSHALNMRWITIPETASQWVMHHIMSFVLAYLSTPESSKSIHSLSPSRTLLSLFYCAPPSPCWHSLLISAVDIWYECFYHPVYTQLQLLQYTHCTDLKPTSICLQVAVSLYYIYGKSNYCQLRRRFVLSYRNNLKSNDVTKYYSDHNMF